jgi:hypothetical protein
MNPPMAGPTENPKLIANRINDTERVLFSGVLKAATDAELAGRNISAVKAYRKIIPAISHMFLVSKSINNTKLQLTIENNMMLNAFFLSVSQPPV